MTDWVQWIFSTLALSDEQRARGRVADTTRAGAKHAAADARCVEGASDDTDRTEDESSDDTDRTEDADTDRTVDASGASDVSDDGTGDGDDDEWGWFEILDE